MTPLDRRGAWSTWSAWRTRLVVSALVWGALALLAWLDRTAPAPAQHAAVFIWVVQALYWVWQAVEAVGGAVAASLVAVVQWLVSALGWLSSHVAEILKSTGGMFARVWESAKLFYENVLRPALVWLYDFYTKVRDWLAKVFKPVFDFLKDVRDVLKMIYRRFISPILTIIDVTRAGLRVLGDLGVEWARKLDAKLGEIEGIIQRNFVMVLGRVNQVIDILDSVVNVDRLFQRLPFLRTLNRDAGYWIRIFWNHQVIGLSKEEAERRKAEKYRRNNPAVARDNLKQYFTSGEGPLAAEVDYYRPILLAAAGVDLQNDDGSSA